MKYVILFTNLVVFSLISTSWAEHQDEGDHWINKHPATCRTAGCETLDETGNSPIQVASTTIQPTQEQICIGILELRIAAQDGRYKKMAVGKDGSDLEIIDDLYNRECSKFRSPEGLSRADQEKNCLGILELRIAVQDGRYKKMTVGDRDIDLKTIDELYKRKCSKIRSVEGLNYAYERIGKALD